MGLNQVLARMNLEGRRLVMERLQEQADRIVALERELNCSSGPEGSRCTDDEMPYCSFHYERWLSDALWKYGQHMTLCADPTRLDGSGHYSCPCGFSRFLDFNDKDYEYDPTQHLTLQLAEAQNKRLVERLRAGLRDHNPCDDCWGGAGHLHHERHRRLSLQPHGCPCQCHKDDDWPDSARALLAEMGESEEGKGEQE